MLPAMVFDRHVTTVVHNSTSSGQGYVLLRLDGNATVSNAFMGSVPNHPVLTQCIARQQSWGENSNRCGCAAAPAC